MSMGEGSEISTAKRAALEPTFLRMSSEPVVVFCRFLPMTWIIAYCRGQDAKRHMLGA